MLIEALSGMVFVLAQKDVADEHSLVNFAGWDWRSSEYLREPHGKARYILIQATSCRLYGFGVKV